MGKPKRGWRRMRQQQRRREALATRESKRQHKFWSKRGRKDKESIAAIEKVNPNKGS